MEGGGISQEYCYRKVSFFGFPFNNSLPPVSQMCFPNTKYTHHFLNARGFIQSQHQLRGPLFHNQNQVWIRIEAFWVVPLLIRTLMDIKKKSYLPLHTLNIEHCESERGNSSRHPHSKRRQRELRYWNIAILKARQPVVIMLPTLGVGNVPCLRSSSPWGSFFHCCSWLSSLINRFWPMRLQTSFLLVILYLRLSSSLFLVNWGATG